MQEILIQLHKGNTTVSNTSTYTPTQYELQLQKQAADYSNAVAPNALWLNNVARGLLQDSIGTVQVDYNKLAQNANNQISQAQQGVQNLTQGILPAEYQANMEKAITSGVQNTVGNTISALGNRGVLNSSVTNTALNDISKNATDTMAQQYQQNIGTLNGLYGQQATLANQPMVTYSAAQEAAQQPAMNAWNASMGLNTNGTTSTLAAAAGQGTTTSTQSTSGGGGGIWGSLFGLGSSFLTGAGGQIACFTADTKIKTPDGEKEILNIKVGDEVVAYNPETGEDEVAEVIEVMEPRNNDVYVIATGEGKVNTTTTQSLMASDDTFVLVGAITLGTELKGKGKAQSIVYSGEHKVYDIKVSGPNTYYADGFIANGATNEW